MNFNCSKDLLQAGPFAVVGIILPAHGCIGRTVIVDDSIIYTLLGLRRQ
jgi:hypothetical protein